jgi:hypothetical protein
MKNKKNVLNIKIENWKIAFSIIVGMIVSGIALFVGLNNAFHGKQEYYDIIVREIALCNSNKTGELNTVWGALFLGVIATIIAMIFISKRKNSNNISEKAENDILDFIIAFLIIPSVLIYLFNSSVNKFVIELIIVLLVFLLFEKKYLSKVIADKETVLKTIILFVSTYYALLAIWALLQSYETKINVKRISIILWALLWTGIILAISIRNKSTVILGKIAIAMQLFIPLLLFTGLITRYNYNGKIVDLAAPKRYVLLIVTIILLLLLYALFSAIKRYRNINNCECKYLILPTTIMVIFAFQLFTNANYVYSSDFWHTGEELLPWQQIVQLGLTPYKEYTSESGLYPMYFGFIQNVLLDGKVLSYNYAWFLQYLFAGLFSGWVLYRFAGAEIGLIIAMFVGAYDYNRTLLMLPSILILCILAERKDKITWLLGWVTLSFLNGLYYPIYGMALLVGTLPYAVFLIYSLIKEGSIKKELNKKKIAYGAGLLAVILFSAPLLLRIAKNVLELSNQSKLADGITAVGYSKVPDGFLGFLKNHEYMRSLLFATYKFSVPIIILLIFVVLMFYYVRRKDISTSEKYQSPAFVLLSLGMVTLPITYTFGFIRMDIDWFLARTSVVLIIFTGLVLVVFIYKYGKAYLRRATRNVMLGIAMFVTIYMIGVPFGNEYNKIRNSHDVNDQFEYVDNNSNIPKLGNGFITKNSNYILNTTKSVKDAVLDKDEKIFFLSGAQALYYLLNQESYTKDAAIYTVADGVTQNRNIEMLKKNPPKLVQFDPLSVKEYYIYHWLMQNGYVYFDFGGMTFLVDKDRFNERIGNSTEAAYNMIANCDIEKYTSRNLEGTCTAWGNSMKSLQKIFTDVNEFGKSNVITTEDGFAELTFESSIYGFDADFIYMDLQLPENMNDTSLRIYWSGEEIGYNDNTFFEMKIKDGKVLIPMGAAPSWLLAHNTRIKFVVNGLPGNEVGINSIKLLKLNCDRFDNNN